MEYAISETSAFKMVGLICRLKSWPDCNQRKNFLHIKQIVSVFSDYVFKIFSKFYPGIYF